MISSDSRVPPHILALALEHGRKHFDCDAPPVDQLEAHLAKYLFGVNGICLVLEARLITQREARDLLIQRTHDFYRVTLALGGSMGPDCNDQEIERIDTVLFGGAASDRP